jgi:hypothetical protein
MGKKKLEGTTEQKLLRSANLPGNPSSFFFERTDSETGGIETFAEVFPNKRFETAIAFTLRDMDELMHEQLAIAPAIGANNNSVADARATGGGGNEDVFPREIREPLIIRKRETFHDQNSDAGTILNASSVRIRGVLRR